MKKIFASILAMVMVLSVLWIPTAADTPSGSENRILADGEALPGAARASGWGTPAIDGTKEEIYRNFSNVTGNFDGKFSNASFDLYFANDAEHLYFYMEVTVPYGDTNKTELLSSDLSRLYIDFYNQHTQVYRATENEYQKAWFNTDVSKNQTAAGSASNYNGGQFMYTPSTGSVSGSRGAAAGIGSVAGGDVKFVIQYSDGAKADVSGYVVEARIDLPDYVRADINAGEQPIIGVGYEVRNNQVQPQYNLTYLDSSEFEKSGDYFGWLWADYTVAPDLVLSNSTPENRTDFGFTTDLCADASDCTVVIDGKMEPGEGWAALPYVCLDRTSSNGSDLTGTISQDIPKIYLSADADFIYLCYETRHMECKWLYFQFGFGEECTNSDQNLFVEARVGLLAADGSADAFRVKWKSGTYVSGDDFYDNTQYVLKTETDRKVVEMKIPVPESVKMARVNGAFRMNFGALERISNASNGGYLSAAGFSWEVGKISLTLPRIDDPEAAGLPQWIEDSKANAYHESMKNLTVNIIGDSYFKGNGLMEAHVWPALLSEKYEWSYFNYGKNGNMVSTYQNADSLPLVKRYRQMTNNSPDLVIINGGRNDYNHGVPIGTSDSKDTDTFMGALNVMFAGLRSKYPEAMFVYTTVWNFPNTNAESTLTYLDYAKAAEQICSAWGVYCFHAYDPAVSGVDMTSEAFRSAYCMSPDDISHLNLSGMKLVMPKYEQFLSESLAHWEIHKEEILAGLNKDDPSGGGDNQPVTTAPGGDATETPVTTAPSGGKDEKGCKSMIGLPVLTVMVILAAAAAGYVCCGRRTKRRE